MATLTNTDFREIIQTVRSIPAINDDFKTWGLSKAQWHGALQAIETYMVSGLTTRPATSIKAAIEAQTGATTTTRAANVLAIWANWKYKNYVEGL